MGRPLPKFVRILSQSGSSKLTEFGRVSTKFGWKSANFEQHLPRLDQKWIESTKHGPKSTIHGPISAKCGPHPNSVRTILPRSRPILARGRSNSAKLDPENQLLPNLDRFRFNLVRHLGRRNGNYVGHRRVKLAELTPELNLVETDPGWANLAQNWPSAPQTWPASPNQPSSGQNPIDLQRLRSEYRSSLQRLMLTWRWASRPQDPPGRAPGLGLRAWRVRYVLPRPGALRPVRLDICVGPRAAALGVALGLLPQGWAHFLRAAGILGA